MNNLPRKDYEYLLGAYLGDGTPYYKYGIKMTTAEDDYRDVLLEIMQPLRPRLGQGKDTCHRILAGNQKNPCGHLFIPYKKDFFWQRLPKLKYPEHFIAGIFDTDGSFPQRIKRKFNAEVLISQKRKENLELLIPILEKMWIYPAIWRSGRRVYPIHLLGITHWTQVRIFANRIPSRHPRKAALLKEAKNYLFVKR